MNEIPKKKLYTQMWLIFNWNFNDQYCNVTTMLLCYVWLEIWAELCRQQDTEQDIWEHQHPGKERSDSWEHQQIEKRIRQQQIESAEDARWLLAEEENLVSLSQVW